jgi:type IV pilus assembly protein PilV
MRARLGAPEGRVREERPRATRRTALIEALVALLVFAAGLLGIAALYAQGRIGGRNAELRARAVELAADLAERMRANRVAAETYGDARSGAGATGVRCDGVRCSPAELAHEDKAAWLGAVRQRLPGGAASVIARADGRGYTVTVMWREPALGPGKYALSFTP